eukprot:Gregarina_sp_Poly_1__11470@NODE_986_length_5468_cov_55_534160_g693_i0_p4_GENE_NODE_986_length_5468_cov_55_534160_g693_i0NODE_986_length_5468_cov_55_534160_g693_i0_p4_ORF_typecomplete_len147_score25_92_NODE_986_length_5468_cov_55_534160_g693_i044314871
MGSKCFKDTVHYVRQVDDDKRPKRRHSAPVEMPDKFEKPPPRDRNLRQRLHWKGPADNETETTADTAGDGPPRFPRASPLRKRDRVKPAAVSVKNRVSSLFKSKPPPATKPIPAPAATTTHTFKRADQPPDVPWPTATAPPPWPTE